MILVAHRLSTLRDAGRIFVFDEGQVVETGTYDELVHRGGAFAELVHSAGGTRSRISRSPPARSSCPGARAVEICRRVTRGSAMRTVEILQAV